MNEEVERARLEPVETYAEYRARVAEQREQDRAAFTGERPLEEWQLGEKLTALPDPTFTLDEMRAAGWDEDSRESALQISANRAMHRMYGPYLEQAPAGVRLAFEEGYFTAALIARDETEQRARYAETGGGGFIGRVGAAYVEFTEEAAELAEACDRAMRAIIEGKLSQLAREIDALFIGGDDAEPGAE